MDPVTSPFPPQVTGTLHGERGQRRYKGPTDASSKAPLETPIATILSQEAAHEGGLRRRLPPGI